MQKVLIVFAHPAYQKSRVNRKLLRALESYNQVTVDDLYEKYPDFFIPVEQERKLIKEHDCILLQHPLYWYAAPSLLKEWMDVVLGHGFGATPHWIATLWFEDIFLDEYIS